MKRRTFLVCTAALFCSAFLAGGCTQKTSQPVLQQIEYSNLADSDTQALLSKLLQDAGVSDLRIQTFFDHVQKFNNAVDPAWLTTGFENAKPSDLKYDPYSMQDAWTEKYDTFPGWNCRITACGLFGDFITVTGKADLDSAEDTLFMDYETLDSDPESLCGDERQKFDALFAPVKTTNTTDIPTHLKTIQQEWKKRGLSFVEDDKIRLVSVVLHDQFSETDNSLMIGHIGVMLPTSDAVYFVEKVAFQEPYRLLKFKKSNRVERLSDAEIRQLVGTRHRPHLYYGKFRSDGRLAHIGHSGLKSEISSMPKSRGISSPLLFSFCTLSRYLYHSFQHCQLVFTPFFYSFFASAAYLFAFQSNTSILCIFCCILSMMNLKENLPTASCETWADIN